MSTMHHRLGAVLAIVVSLLVPLWNMSRQGYGLSSPDSCEYAQIARCLAQQQGYSTYTLWVSELRRVTEVPPPDVRRPPLFPVFLSLAFRLAGATDQVAQWSTAFWSAAAGMILYFLGQAFFGPLVGLVAMGLYWCLPTTLYLSTSGLTEPMFLALLLVWWWRLGKTSTPKDALLAGLLLGLLQLTRNNAFVLLPAGWWFLARRPQVGKLKLMGMLLVGFLLLVGPWLWRQYLVSGTFSPAACANYAIINDSAGYPLDAAEEDFLPPTPLEFMRHHAAAVADKFMRYLAANVTALGGGFPLITMGLLVLGAFAFATGPLRYLWESSLLGLALTMLLFSVGEPEGPRFFYPFAPWLTLLGLGALAQLWPELQRVTGRSLALAGVVLLVGLIPALPVLSGPRGEPQAVEARVAWGAAIAAQVPADKVILSDSPWMIGWYAGRLAAWMPYAPDDLRAVDAAVPVAAMLVNPEALQRELAGNLWTQLLRSPAALPGYTLSPLPPPWSDQLFLVAKSGR